MEWSRPHALQFVAAVGLGLAGLLMLAWRLARSSDARSVIIVGLRASALIILLLILLDPIRKVETRTPGERPTAIFLSDGSRSMGLEQPVTRIDRVERIQRDAAAALDPSLMPKIDRYRFGRSLAALKQKDRIRPVDDDSNLLDALARLPTRFGETPPAGVFVFSDGRSNNRTSVETIAKGYRQLGVPIHVIPVGDPSISGDVAIRDLVVPRDAPKGSKIKVKVLVGNHGFAGKRAELEIRPSTGSDLRPLATLPLTLGNGDQPAELVIEADRARSPMVVEIHPLPGEAVVENNSMPFQVKSRNQKIRVIYMEGSPGTEYAFIRNALIENPDIECVAMTVNAQNNFQPRLYRVDDPSRGYPTTREELLGYDVIICSDIARAAFTPEQIDWTVELVAQRGGGFGMIGGNTSFGSGGWDRTPWDGMIPIDMSGEPGQNSRFFNGDFRVVVPAGVENHPIWRIVEDPAKNHEILRRIPTFHGTNLTDRLKPAATVLGVSEHPLSGMINIPTQRPQGQNVASIGPAGTKTQLGTPIFSVQTYGRGRSFAMSTDSTISWGSDFETKWGERDNRYFRKFWRNVIIWLAENSSISSRRLEVSADKVVYRPGEKIQVVATAYDEKLESTDRYTIRTRLVRSGGMESKESSEKHVLVNDMPLSLRRGNLEYSGSLSVPSAEILRKDSSPALQMATLEAVAIEAGQTIATTKIEVQILDDSEEFRDPRPDPDRLASLAQRTGGKVLKSANELAEILEKSGKAVDRVTTTRWPVWDQSWVLALLFGLLAMEWVVRRSKGLA